MCMISSAQTPMAARSEPHQPTVHCSAPLVYTCRKSETNHKTAPSIYANRSYSYIFVVFHIQLDIYYLCGELAKDSGTNKRGGTGGTEGTDGDGLGGNLNDGVVGDEINGTGGSGEGGEAGGLEGTGADLDGSAEKGEGTGGEIDDLGEDGEELRPSGLDEDHNVLVGGSEGEEGLKLGEGDTRGLGLGEESGLGDLGEEAGGLNVGEEALHGKVVAGGVDLGGVDAHRSLTDDAGGLGAGGGEGGGRGGEEGCSLLWMDGHFPEVMLKKREQKHVRKENAGRRTDVLQST